MLGLEETPTELLTDPIKFKNLFWPKIQFYDDQLAIIKSVEDNVETYVPAGNMLGKDFISGFIALWFFCSRQPARVVTTSVDYDQLKSVLWGEIRRFIDTAEFPLGVQVNDLLLRQVRPDGSLDPISQCVGRVAQKGEGLLGRHLARGPNNQPMTLAIIDEASGFEDNHYKSITTWAHRILIIGNCYPCDNFFKRGVKAGNVPDELRPGKYYRNVIQIKAERSPSVRLGIAEKKAGLPISNREVLPGVMTYSEYILRRTMWDPHSQKVGLDAEFYEGEELMLYPEDWINAAIEMAELLEDIPNRQALAIGLDPAAGGDDTVWTAGDELGVILQKAKKTSDTSVIYGETKALTENLNVDPRNVIIDLGNGGKEHVDYMNKQGFPVRGVFFGASPTPAELSKEAVATSKGGYKNKRAEMYGILRNLINPNYSLNELLGTIHNLSDRRKARLQGKRIYGIPAKYTELIRQMRPLPLKYDHEGRMYLPPKDKPSPTYSGPTIKSILGCSPDETDSTVLMTYGLMYPVYERRAKVW